VDGNGGRRRGADDRGAEMCPRRAGDRPVLVNESSKARELLGWIPKFPELDHQIMHASWFRDKMPNIQSN